MFNFMVGQWYQQRFGVKDFAWKVRHRMEHSRNPLFVTLTDKYLMKGYAAEKSVKTASLYHVTEMPETIPFDELLENYFIKANHGCKWNIYGESSSLYLFESGAGLVDQNGSLVQPKQAAKYKITQEKCIRICRSWLGKRYSAKEWAYQCIKPRVIVEESLISRTPGDLKDYRLYTFNGEVKVINVGSPTYRKNSENVFFDCNWNEIKLTKYSEEIPSNFPLKPDNLQEMIEAAQRLGRDLDFVRVDLYNTSKGVMLGEMTLYPQSGRKNSPTGCAVFNQWLGDQWK